MADPSELADLEPSEWPALDPAALRELEDGGFDVRAVPDEALPTAERCPQCHWPVFQVTVVGPGVRIFGPCDCRH